MSTANGRITFLEKQIDKTKAKIGELEWKTLQKDIVLYNLPENQKSDREMFIEFLVGHLKISQQAIHSPENAKGSIQIDTTLRIGRRVDQKARPLIISFALLSSKKIIMEQHRKLQLSSPVRITDHYPSEMREKRSVQKDTLKKYRDIYRNSDKPVKLVKDKLIVGTKVTNEAFAVNPLTSSPQSVPQNQSQIEHTFTKEENGSHFQGHACRVGSITEAASARDALFQLPTVTQCDHIIYAYSITDPSGMKINGNSDGGEWAASKILANLIEENQATNTFLAVTRKHDGPNLGQRRFAIISEMGKRALDKL